MSNPANVVKAIESFDSWTSPWEFASRVSAALPDPDDAQLFEQTWAAACDREIWLSADNLVSGTAAVESALLQGFSWLSLLACQQLARGAAYQWR
jgi:hypothetical protein